MAADGRLSAEELDELLGEADPGRSVVEIGAPDELVGGPDPGRGERPLRELVARHRVGFRVAAALVTVAVAGTWWHASRQPSPTSTGIAATVVVSGVGSDDGEVVRTRLAVTPAGRGEQPQALALQGMGLTQPTVTQDGDTVQARNTLACSAVSDVSRQGTYTLRVTPAGATGDEAAQDLPLAGDGDRRITATVIDACVDRATLGMEFRYFAASTQGPAHLKLGLLNPSPWDLYVYGAEAAVGPRDSSDASAGPGVFSTQGGPIRLPAGDVTLVALVPRVDHCGPWQGPVRWAPTTTGGGRRSDLTLFVGPAGVPSGTATIARPGFELYPAQRAAVVHALRLPCSG